MATYAAMFFGLVNLIISKPLRINTPSQPPIPAVIYN